MDNSWHDPWCATARGMRCNCIVVETWRNGDVVGGHEAIGRAEELLQKSTPST